VLAVLLHARRAMLHLLLGSMPQEPARSLLVVISMCSFF
jgi:hypothetical protein